MKICFYHRFDGNDLYYRNRKYQISESEIMTVMDIWCILFL